MRIRSVESKLILTSPPLCVCGTRAWLVCTSLHTHGVYACMCWLFPKTVNNVQQQHKGDSSWWTDITSFKFTSNMDVGLKNDHLHVEPTPRDNFMKCSPETQSKYCTWYIPTLCAVMGTCKTMLHVCICFVNVGLLVCVSACVRKRVDPAALVPLWLFIENADEGFGEKRRKG